MKINNIQLLNWLIIIIGKININIINKLNLLDSIYNIIKKNLFIIDKTYN